MVEAFVLPLVISADDPKRKEITIECLTRLKGQMELIQAMTGIALPSSQQIPLPLSQSEKVSHTTTLSQQLQTSAESSTATKAVPLDLSELEAVIDGFRQKLEQHADPLTLIQSLNEIQPESEDDWTEAMWSAYDEFYDELNQLEQNNFNSQLDTKANNYSNNYT
ncbi:MAG: hypothetical protein AAFQ80_07730 [Cyanobacteria bacterium J06621_8]